MKQVVRIGLVIILGVALMACGREGAPEARGGIAIVDWGL